MNKRIVFWISLICLVVLIIFLLTLQGPDGTIAISVDAQGLLTRIIRFLTGNESWQISVHDVRRLAHVPEYGLLGLVVCIGLNRITGRIWRSAMLTPAFCFVISFTDQIIKWMLPTRHFDASDLVLDVVGYGVATLVVTIVALIVKKQRV